MRMRWILKKILLMLLLILPFQPMVDCKANVIIDTTPGFQALINGIVDKLDNVFHKLENINIKITEFPEVPISLTPETFKHFGALSKTITALCFALLGGFIFKSGLEDLDNKERKKSSIAKVIAGFAITSLSFLYIAKNT